MTDVVPSVDLFIFMTSNTPAIFEIPPRWKEKIFTDSNLLTINKNLDKHTPLGTAFFTSPWSDLIPIDLADIIQSLQHLIPYHEQKVKLGNHSILTDNDHLVLVARQLSATSLKAHLNPFQESIRISICIYFTTRIWSFARAPCSIILVRMLRESLDGCLAHFKALAPDLLFWISFMSCFASRGSEYFAWAARGLKSCAEQLSVFEWYGALPILERFLFVLRESDIAKIVWDEVNCVGMKNAITRPQVRYPAKLSKIDT